MLMLEATTGAENAKLIPVFLVTARQQKWWLPAAETLHPLRGRQPAGHHRPHRRHRVPPGLRKGTFNRR